MVLNIEKIELWSPSEDCLSWISFHCFLGESIDEISLQSFEISLVVYDSGVNHEIVIKQSFWGGNIAKWILLRPIHVKSNGDTFNTCIFKISI